MGRGLEKVAQKLPAPHLTWLVTATGGYSSSGRNNVIKSTKLKLANWNVRTLQDSEHRPERRTALVAAELNRYKIDIATLTETRLEEEGSLTER